MPPPGYSWWHLILNAHSTWLHGNPRGFRSRGHRIHSSGDYKQPPPRGEHARLHAFHTQRSATPTRLSRKLREQIGEALKRKLRKLGLNVLVISVGPTHAHVLLCLPDDVEQARQISAQLKQASSHAVRHAMPGRVWAAGGKPIRIRDRAHQLKVFRYILDHAQKEGAWVWSFRDGVLGDEEWC